MILLLPLGPEAEVPRVPRVTAGLIGLNLVVLLFTSGADTARVEQEDARLEKVADWTLKRAAQDRPELGSLRERYPSALALLAKEELWRQAVADPAERDRLERCLADHRELTRGHPFYRWGFVPSEITLTRLLTHQFLHADILHLFFNMLFLWAVGGLLEATWGAPILAAVYLLSGVAAALTHAFFHPLSAEPAVGASGAVAGLMGCFALAHLREPIRLALVSMIAIAPRISFFSVPAVVFLGFWLLEQVFWALMTARIDLGVAFEAHLGGFAFGTLAALPLKVGWLRNRGED